MNESLERRLVEIEQRLSYSERAAEDLSNVVAAQGRTIDTLERKVSELRRRLEETAAWQPSPQDEQPPPHY